MPCSAAMRCSTLGRHRGRSGYSTAGKPAGGDLTAGNLPAGPFEGDNPVCSKTIRKRLKEGRSATVERRSVSRRGRHM